MMMMMMMVVIMMIMMMMVVIMMIMMIMMMVLPVFYFQKIVKSIQHPLLWEVYSEVSMAQAQNNFQIQISSNCLGEKSQNHFLDKNLQNMVFETFLESLMKLRSVKYFELVPSMPLELWIDMYHTTRGAEHFWKLLFDGGLKAIWPSGDLNFKIGQKLLFL